MVQLLLDYCPIDDAIVGRYTRISWIEAALAGYMECLQVFLDNGFDVNLVIKNETELDRSGTALTMAVQQGILATVMFLSKVPETDFSITSEGFYLLHLSSRALIHRKELVDTLLEMGVDPLQHSRDGKSILHSFLGNGSCYIEQDLELIKTLMLCFKGDLQHVDEQGHTLLHALLDRPYLFAMRNLREAIELIDGQGQMRIRMNKTGLLPLHFAVRARASTDVIRTLIPYEGSLLYPENPGGLNVLHIAVMPGLTPDPPPPPPGSPPPPPPPSIGMGRYIDNGHVVRMLNILLESNGVNVDVRDERGNTPLITLASHCTRISSHKKSLALKLLLEHGADVNACNHRKWSAAHYLTSGGYEVGLCEVLAFSPNLLLLNNNGFSPLQQAIQDGILNSVRLWIERAKAYGQECAKFKQSFQQASSRGLFPIHIATQSRREQIIVLLQDMDMLDDINKRVEGDGSTSLHLAVASRSIICIEALLKSGTDIDAVDNRMRTPLHCAAAADLASIAKLLVEHGARADLKDENGLLPFQITTLRNPTLKTALEMAAKAMNTQTEQAGLTYNKSMDGEVEPVSDHDGVAEMFKASLRNIAPIHSTTISVLEAVTNNNSLACSTLLRAGSDPDKVLNDKQQTALHIACKEGFWSTCNVLLKCNASTSIRNEAGDQPLHNAVVYGNLSIVKQLLKSGADVFARNKKMVTPLHLATECGQITILSCLVEYICSSQSPQEATEHQLDTTVNKLSIIFQVSFPLSSCS